MCVNDRLQSATAFILWEKDACAFLQAQSGDEDGQIDWKLLKEFCHIFSQPCRPSLSPQVARTKSDGRAESLGEGLGRLSPGEAPGLAL